MSFNSGFNLHSSGQSRWFGSSVVSFLRERGHFLIKAVMAFVTTILVALTVVAAERFFYAARPLADADLIFMLQ